MNVAYSMPMVYQEVYMSGREMGLPTLPDSAYLERTADESAIFLHVDCRSRPRESPEAGWRMGVEWRDGLAGEDPKRPEYRTH